MEDLSPGATFYRGECKHEHDVSRRSSVHAVDDGQRKFWLILAAVR